jgi:hypothetical protein
MKPLIQGLAGRHVARRQLDVDPPVSQQHWPGLAASGSGAEAALTITMAQIRSALSRSFADPRLSAVTLRDWYEVMAAVVVDRFVDRNTGKSGCNERYPGVDLWHPCS